MFGLGEYGRLTGMDALVFNASLLVIALLLGAVWSALRWRRFSRRFARSGFLGRLSLLLTGVLLPGIVILLAILLMSALVYSVARIK